MKALVLAALVMFAAGAARADFAAGWAAYEAGAYEQALDAWLPLARRGDLDATYNVAALYENGLGVAANPDRAVDWYTRAAERGLALAQYRLARIFEAGLGVAPDREKALAWYRKAAGQGRAEAQFNLGVAYETGSLVAPDVG